LNLLLQLFADFILENPYPKGIVKKPSDTLIPEITGADRDFLKGLDIKID